MSKEAMKLALEALKTLVDRFDFEQFTSVCELDDAKDAIKSLEEALANEDADAEIIKYHEATIARLQEALAKQEQGEPVAWQERQARRMQDSVVTEWTNWYPCRYRTIDEARADVCDHIPYEWRPLYTTPQQRTWVGLTNEQFIYFCSYVRHDVLSEIEEKLKELNT